MRALALTVCFALGCAPPETEISGSVGSTHFAEVGTAYFGGPFLFLADEVIDCMDVYWVTRNYTTGQPVHEDYELDFVGLQFAFSGDDLLQGTFSVAGEAQVSSKLLVQEAGVLDEHRGRGGFLIIDDIEADSSSGTLELTFDDGELTGSFYAEQCINLKDN